MITITNLITITKDDTGKTLFICDVVDALGEAAKCAIPYKLLSKFNIRLK